MTELRQAERDATSRAAQRHRVVVVGGGFGGLNAVRALAHADVDVTVVDRTNHHLFQPLLYQVAAGILPPGLIAPALRSVIKKQRNARALLADVNDLDLEPRVVHADGAGRARASTLPYDTLVVAAGATHSYFGRDDFAEFAPGMKTIEDARHLRDADPARLRDGRAGHRPGGAGRVADLRRDRRRPDRAWSSSARWPSWRTRCCRATTGRSTPARRGSSCSRARPSVLPPFAEKLQALHAPARWRRWASRSGWHAGRRHGRRARVTVKGPDGEETIRTRTRIWAAGVAGLPAGGDAGRADRRRDRPGRPDRGEPRLHAAGPSGGLRDRRHGLAQQAARASRSRRCRRASTSAS